LLLRPRKNRQLSSDVIEHAHVDLVRANRGCSGGRAISTVARQQSPSASTVADTFAPPIAR
jgi:hypothetical protein